MGFQQGLSGLNAASRNLDVIGNNVANASTVGFKASVAHFADVYASSLGGGGGGNSAGIGTTVSSIAQQFQQGNISSTSNPLDVAVNGEGFFRMSKNGTITYTRNGQFQLDKDGYITNDAGLHLTGFPVDASGQVVTSTPVDLQLSRADIDPSVTTEAAVNVNLDSRLTAPTLAFNMTDPRTYNSATSMSVYDSLGNAHTLSLYFRKTGNNTWQVYGANDGTALGASLGTLTFTSGGQIDTAATTLPFTTSIPLTNGATTPLDFDLTFNGTTQFGSAFGVNSLTQDGYASGKLTGFAISDDGVVQGRYSNGQTRPQGQIVLANFTNPQGLTPLGGNQWMETNASGQPQVGSPGSGTLGALQSGALEDSNVDLTAELVNMITAQRVYQANAQTIKTQDSVLQTLVNLR